MYSHRSKFNVAATYDVGLLKDMYSVWLALFKITLLYKARVMFLDYICTSMFTIMVLYVHVTHMHTCVETYQ